MMNLAYFAADTLNMTLFQVGGKLLASEIHQLRVGPWRIDLPMDVRSDIMTATEMGFWMVLNKTLRCYLVVKENDGWLFVLDSAKLKEVGKKTGFAGTNATARTVELKPAIKGVFRWKNNKWAHIQYDANGAVVGG